MNVPVALLPGDTDWPPLAAFFLVLIVLVAAMLLLLTLIKSWDNVPAVLNGRLLVVSVVAGFDTLPDIHQYWVVLAVVAVGTELEPRRVFAIHPLALYQYDFTNAKPII